MNSRSTPLMESPLYQLSCCGLGVCRPMLCRLFVLVRLPIPRPCRLLVLCRPPMLCRLELVPDKLGCWYKLDLEGPLISRLLREPLLTRRCKLVQLMVLDLCTLLLPLPLPNSSSCSSSSQIAASKGKTVQQPPPGAEIIFIHSLRASARLSCRKADLCNTTCCFMC